MKHPILRRVIPRLVMTLAVLLLFVAPTLAQAQFTYTTNTDGTLTLTSYTGTGGDLTFPTNINGLTVSGLGENILLFNSNVTSVTIPGSITNMAEFTFYMCGAMTNAISGYGITALPSFMFTSCQNLASVTIPGSVKTIGQNAFTMSALTQITVPSGVTSIAGAFGDCLVLTNITLPLGLTNMDGAFAACPSLLSVTIPSTVTNIGASTFYYCTSLTNVLIPNSVLSIDSEAFFHCTSLGSITIPASVTNIADGSEDNSGVYATFTGCSSLTNVTILGAPYIGAYTFYGLNLTSVSIAGGIIGQSAFQFCKSLTNVTFGNNLAAVGGLAFSTDPISKIFIPSTVTNISYNAFGGSQLTNVVFGAGVTGIQDFAFDQDYHLTQTLFLGNAPTVIQSGDQPPFGECPVTVYYLSGTTGWSNTFGQTIYQNDGAPTALWNPVIQTRDGHFGVTNGLFGFNITNGGNASIPIAIMACTNLVNPVWTPLTNVILTNTYYFTDPQWTNYPNRHYGVGFP